MKKRSIDIGGIITQFVLIVFSVVLGLYLSERIEERKKIQESEELLAKIKAEVKDNIILLNEWVPYHQEIKWKLDSIYNDPEFIEAFVADKFAFFERLLSKGTFMGRSPANDAWDIAKAHPLIVNFEYDKLLILSRIYKQQEMTFEPAMKMIEIFDSKGVNSSQEARANLEVMLNHWHELVAREEQLMVYYREGVEILGLRDEK